MENKFLDDQIVSFFENVHHNNSDFESSLKDAIKKSVQSCFEKMKKDVSLCSDDSISYTCDCSIAAVKRVCISWNSAAEKLAKNGKDYLAKDGFKDLLLSKPEFQFLTKYIK